MEPKQQAPYPLRMPAELRDRLEKAAKESSRSMNSEVVARLQASFDLVGVEQGELQALQGELEQQRGLAQQFQAAADLSDGTRALLAYVLLSALNKLPEAEWPGGIDSQLASGIARWLTERDRRGAIFSLLNIIEGVDGETLETLRNFAGYLEDHDLTSDSVALRLAEASIQRRNSPENKMIVVGNLGRDPEVRTFPERADVHGVKVGGAMVPRPTTPRGPVKSSNARKAGPKKKP